MDNNYIILSDDKGKKYKSSIIRLGDKNCCINCKDKPDFVLTFGKGVDEINIKLCRDCLESYKDKLDKEFGYTFWGTINKLLIKEPKRKMKIDYYNEDNS